MTVTTGLPAAVIKEDHRLEETANRGSLVLMEYRWHWTLDESNPKRTTVADYAHQIGRAYWSVYPYARGHEIFSLKAKNGEAVTPDDARRLARMDAETAAATEAVVKHYGGSIQSTQRRHPGEARTIRDRARQRAEEKGTDPLDEIAKVAEFTYKVAAAEERRQTERKQRRPQRYIEIEAGVQKARRALLDAARVAEGVDFDAEERELLADSLDNLKRLLHLLDRAIAGVYDKSWRTELSLIEGGRSA